MTLFVFFVRYIASKNFVVNTAYILGQSFARTVSIDSNFHETLNI